MVGPRATDLSRRERCEDQEMEGCVLATKEKCIGFARDKCAASFLECADCGEGRASEYEGSWEVDRLGIGCLYIGVRG
jgi:hypothetical protein